MKKTILAVICATAIGATPIAAFAQTSGPAGQDSSKMGTGTMQKTDGASQTSGTQGMSKDSMSKDGMSKDSMKKDSMHNGSKDSMKNDNNMMKKN